MVGFEFSMYNVAEDEGPQTVCVLVIEGGSQIPVSVTVNSRDGTATSTCELCTLTQLSMMLLVNTTFKDDAIGKLFSM